MLVRVNSDQVVEVRISDPVREAAVDHRIAASDVGDSQAARVCR